MSGASVRTNQRLGRGDAGGRHHLEASSLTWLAGIGTSGYWPEHLNMAYLWSLSTWPQTSGMEACGSKGECPRTRQRLYNLLWPSFENTVCVTFTIVPDEEGENLRPYLSMAEVSNPQCKRRVYGSGGNNYWVLFWNVLQILHCHNAPLLLYSCLSLAWPPDFALRAKRPPPSTTLLWPDYSE